MRRTAPACNCKDRKGILANGVNRAIATCEWRQIAVQQIGGSGSQKDNEIQKLVDDGVLVAPTEGEILLDERSHQQRCLEDARQRKSVWQIHPNPEASISPALLRDRQSGGPWVSSGNSAARIASNWILNRGTSSVYNCHTNGRLRPK